MKRITAFFLSVLFLCTALVPMAVHADAMDQKLQEELGSINFWYEACFDEEVELTYCKYLADEITWEFWDGLADEDDYYIDLSSQDVLEYLTWRCGENTGSSLFASVKEGVEDSGFEYDEETDTFRFYSGGFGGFRYNREYRGYVKYGNWYRVFYADTVQVDLYDLYYNGRITEEEYENAISTGVFDGHEVLSSMGDYYYVAEVKKSGIRYHVQFAADGHAIIDLPQYVGESEFPDEFDQEGELDHDGVFITKHPQSIEVLEDSFAIFTVEADTEIVEYKWYYKASDATKYSLHSHTDDPQFCFDMIPERDGWQVYCVVTDVHGCTAKSEIATATMVKRGDFANQLADDVSGLNFWAEHHPTASVENLYYNFMKEDIFLHCPGTMDDEGYVHVDATDAYNRIYRRAEEELAAEVWSAFLENRVNGIRFDEENREFVGVPAAFGGGIPNRVYRGFNGAGEEDTWRVYYADCETVILEDLLYYGEITQNEYDAAVKNGVYNGYPLEENDFHYFVKDVLDSGIYYTVKYQNGRTTLSLPRYYDETLTPYFEHEGVKITKHPEDVYRATGLTAELRVNAEGNNLSYKWYYKDKGASSFTLTNTFKGASYSVEMTAARSGREVYCVVTDELGQSMTSKVAKLTQKIRIKTQPKSVQVAKGKTAKVTVSAEGEGLTYKWYYKDKGMSSFKRTTTFKGASYSVQMTAARSGRQVYCVVTDEYGNTVTTKIVTLSMKARIATQPKSVTVAKNKTAKVTVKAEGEGLKYTWYVKKAGATKFTKSSVKTSSYSVKMTSSSANRQLYCKVTDKFGNTVTTKTVSMKMK